MRRCVLLVTLSLVLASTAVGSAAAGDTPRQDERAGESQRDSRLESPCRNRAQQPTCDHPAHPGCLPGAGQVPPVAELHLAMVQGAVYDAVNAIDGGHEPYLAGLPAAPSTASQAAAAATAAHHVLVGLGGGLVPSLPAEVIAWLDAAYAASLAGIADGQPKLDGIAAGEAAAEAMLEEREDDGRYVPFSFSTGTATRPVAADGGAARQRPVRLGRESRAVPARAHIPAPDERTARAEERGIRQGNTAR